MAGAAGPTGAQGATGSAGVGATGPAGPTGPAGGGGGGSSVLANYASVEAACLAGVAQWSLFRISSAITLQTMFSPTLLPFSNNLLTAVGNQGSFTYSGADMVQIGDQSIWSLNPAAHTVVGAPFAGTWSVVLSGIIPTNASAVLMEVHFDDAAALGAVQNGNTIQARVWPNNEGVDINRWTATGYNGSNLSAAFTAGFYMVLSRTASGNLRIVIYTAAGTVVSTWQTNAAYTYINNAKLFSIYSDRNMPITWRKGMLFSGSPGLSWQQFAALP